MAPSKKYNSRSSVTKKGKMAPSKKYNTRSSVTKKGTTHFRSSISPLVRDINEIKGLMRKRHITAMKSTPFKLLFMALYNDKMKSNKDTRKWNQNIVKILDSYDPIQKGFLIGGKCLRITTEDISVIFGIPKEPKIQENGKKGKKAKKEEKGSLNDSELFMDSYFPKGTKIKKDLILKKMKMVVNIRSDEAVNDFKVLTCALICCTLFFHNSAGVLARNLIKTLYKDIDRISWAEKILETLMMYVEKYKNEQSVPGGGTMALLYWLAEYVQLTSMKNNTYNEIPRALRWDINDIDEAVSKTTLSSINDKMIKTSLTLSKVEDKIIKGQIYDGTVEVVGTNEQDIQDDFDETVEAKTRADIIDGMDFKDYETIQVDVANYVEEEDDDVEVAVEEEDDYVEAEDDDVDVHGELEELRKENKKLKKSNEKLKKSHEKLKQVMKKVNQLVR